MKKFTTANGRLVLLNPETNTMYSARYQNDHLTYGHTLFVATPQQVHTLLASATLSEVQPTASR